MSELQTATMLPLDDAIEPTSQTETVLEAPSPLADVEVKSAPTFITEQELLFATAAADNAVVDASDSRARRYRAPHLRDDRCRAAAAATELSAAIRFPRRRAHGTRNGSTLKRTAVNRRGERTRDTRPVICLTPIWMRQVLSLAGRVTLDAGCRW